MDDSMGARSSDRPSLNFGLEIQESRIFEISDFPIPHIADYCVGALFLLAEESTAIWVGLRSCTTRCVVC